MNLIASSPRRPAFHSARNGAALIVTLAMICLMTVLIVAFFSYSTSNMKVEASRANQKEADIVARSAGAYVETVFLQEIASKTYSTRSPAGNTTVYLPISPVNIMPRRLLPATVSAVDPSYYNLIRQSTASVDPSASSESTTNAAANGRVVGADQWNMPVLIGGKGFTSAQVPHWIYIDRIGGITNTATMTAAGRFAYNVYDIGGLLNVNAAGTPRVLGVAQASFLKGTPAGADLMQLTGLQGRDLDALIAFRNPQQAQNAAFYADATFGALRSGFLNPFFTNTIPSSTATYLGNYFAGRKDLLRYARTQNPDITNALPFLTHFTRSVNAPSWRPQTPTGSAIDYASLSANTGSINRNVLLVRFANGGSLTHYRDDGSVESDAVLAGDPLLQRRFSLAKLAWITSTGVSGSISNGPAAVLACFGLVWNAGTESWTYGVTDGNGAIKTLDQVALEMPPREPNFFELLKAGILTGSVGRAEDNTTLAGTTQTTLDGNGDLQILRIGANIVDCAKSDNYPTTLLLKVGGVTVPVHGVQDLPYLYGTLITSLYNQSMISVGKWQMKWISLVAVPLLLNPHRTPATLPSSGPTSIRVHITQGTVGTILHTSYGTVGSPFYRVANANLTGMSITTPITSASFRNGLGPITAGPSATTISTLVPNAATTANNSIDGFCLYTYTDLTAADYFDPGLGGVLRTTFSPAAPLEMTLEFQSPGGQWRVYDTFGGNEAYPSAGINGTLDYSPLFSITTAALRNTLGFSGAIMKWDPRSGRYGVSRTDSLNATTPAPVPNLSTVNGLKWNLPFGLGNVQASLNGHSGIYSALWAQGGTRDWSDADVSGIVNEHDVDKVIRPADGWLGASGIIAGPANLFSNVTTTTNPARPVLLHRPFQNVAELGYVFRDSPWKSLSFFDPSSGDGALLEFFSVTDEPTVGAGRVNLNTRQPLVLQSLLSGATLDALDGSTATLPNPAALSASYLGAASAYGLDASGNPTSDIIANLSQLPAFVASLQLGSAFSTASYPVKYQREAVVRALVGGAQTRTWNLLIDVVAQCGAPSSTSGGFIVDGEKHYWLSVAIDRYTGQIVDSQWESINE